MLWRTSDLIGYGLRATDGAIGAIDDVLFGDRDWTIRSVVTDTGTWLPGRKVLLPPAAFGEADPVGREIPVELSRKRIEDSPGIEHDRPVSRQVEADLYGHYGYAPYWGGAYGMPAYYAPVAGAAGSVPSAAAGTAPPDQPDLHGAEPAAAPVPASGTSGAGEGAGDPRVRSANEVIGYYIQATDGDIGHVEDILIDSGSWATRYLMVDTRNWWPGRTVLISPRWARDVSWNDRKVFVDVTCERVRESSEYDPVAPVDRGYEERLHGYYGYPPYWPT